MEPSEHFRPCPPLFPGLPHPSCRGIVIIPARNEQETLAGALESLRLQVDARGRPLDHDLYEVILLLNNCADASANVADNFHRQHPTFHLHVAERTFSPAEAHVGNARRLLMDTAWHRLQDSRHNPTAILSTDADTTVASDWVFRNLRAMEEGAEAVGGMVHLKPTCIRHLDPRILDAYRLDRMYQHNVAHVESLLDPDPFDPWPRHLEHFGASIACTPDIYRRAGGLPPLSSLEDVAFVDALRRAGARLRHAPDVSIYTSARLDGRAEVGLSWQLRTWQQEAAAHRPQLVESAASLIHRFSSLAQLRFLWSLETLPSLASYSQSWRRPIEEFHSRRLSQPTFLAEIGCDQLIRRTFHGVSDAPILRVIEDLGHAIRSLTRAQTSAGRRAVPDEAISAMTRLHHLAVPFA